MIDTPLLFWIILGLALWAVVTVRGYRALHSEAHPIVTVEGRLHCTKCGPDVLCSELR